VRNRVEFELEEVVVGEDDHGSTLLSL
jgi:hypothetical protein